MNLSQLLPEANPKNTAERKNRRYFYENVTKPLIQPMVRLMLQGIPTDPKAISDLQNTVDDVLEDVDTRLDQNYLIKKFRGHKFKELSQKKRQELLSKQRGVDYYLKPYKDTDLVMRSYLVNTSLAGGAYNLEFWPEGILPDGTTKWSVNDVKKFLKNNPLSTTLLQIVDKTIDPNSRIVHTAMYNLAVAKARKFNSTYDTKIEDINMDIVPPFNPGSSLQKQELFSYLEIPCEEQSKKTGADSWSRSEIERVQRETDDQKIKNLCQIFIDHSFSAIIRNNFINAFHKYIVDGTLYGNVRIGGTKTFRPTSNNPNLLNQPSTGSIYAKPLKKCFVAPPGYLVWQIDFSALEDRVIASLSEDKNKCALFQEGLDGHSLATTYYFPDKVKEIIGDFTENKDAAIRLKQAVDDKTPGAKALRQSSKGVSFGLNYGSYPPKVAKTIGCSLSEAEQIFDSYHNEMYAGISQMREEVLSEVRQTGENYLGMGFYMRTDDPEKHARTLFNGNSQFWSLLTLLSLAELDEQIIARGQNDVHITATVYDSIYGIAKIDATTIKWLNDTIVPIMTRDFMPNQAVKNTADLCIGTNWGEETEIPNNASLEEIQEILDETV